jgi:short-chain Z-isoprenyl diphosphate synthase
MILDGNRRWAKDRGLPLSAGYRRGGERVLEVLPECEQAGIEVVTLWPLSTDNLARSADVLSPLIKVITTVVGQLARQHRWNLNLIGNTQLLPTAARDQLDAAIADGSGPRRMTVNIAAAYGGRDEIIRTVSRMITAHQQAGTMDRLTHGVSPTEFATYLDTAGQPDLDLIIRTSGEQRLSGFMLWQAANAEFYFSDILWPDFEPHHLHEALESYAARERRHGL